MAGINQGTPEAAIGEPIRLGSNNEFEIEQHPISDRLIIRDTVNGKVAYVRKERGGQIGGDGVLVKALKEGKPMADDGRTYDTIQQAERAASGWVFVPPGTFNESVSIDTEGLTLRGSGYNTHIDGGNENAIDIKEENVAVENVRVRTNSGSGSNTVYARNDNITLDGLHVTETGNRGINNETPQFHEGLLVTNCTVETSDNAIIVGDSSIVVNTYVSTSSGTGITTNRATSGSIIANNIVDNPSVNGIRADTSIQSDIIIIGNRVMNAGDYGIQIDNNTENSIVANNRVSDSASSDISDNGTGTLLDANLTGASN